MEDSNENLYQLEDIHVSQIVSIQALVRGYLVRKWMREIRECYTGIVAEMEQNPRVKVAWDSEGVCRPKVVKYSKQQLQKLIDKQTAEEQVTLLRYSDQLDTDRLSVKTDETSMRSISSIPGLGTVQSFTTQELSNIDDIRKREPFQKTYIASGVDIHVESVHSSISGDEDTVDLLVNRSSLDTVITVVPESRFTTTETQTSFIETPTVKSPETERVSFADKKDTCTNTSSHDLRSFSNMTTSSNAEVKITKEQNNIYSDNVDHEPSGVGDMVSPNCGLQANARSTQEVSRGNIEMNIIKDEPLEVMHTRIDRIKDTTNTKNESVYSDGDVDKMSDKSERSAKAKHKVKPIAMRSVSPVEHKTVQRMNNAAVVKEKPTLMSHDSTTLTNVTSVWDSFNSVRDSFRHGAETEMPAELPQDPETLKELRKNIAMELLWIQQAINSRKNYLKLRSEL